MSHNTGSGKDKKRVSDGHLQLSVSWAVCMRIIVSIFVLYLAITCWKPVIGVIWQILSAGFPLFLGFVIAYVVNILMNVYERHYFRSHADKKWVSVTRRPVCLTGAILTGLGAVALLLWIVIPQLANAVTVITKRLPDALTALSGNAQVMEMLPESIQTAIHELDYNKLFTGVMDFLTNGATTSGGSAAVTLGNNLKGVLGSLSSKFMTGFMGFIFSIYILAGKEKLKVQFNGLYEVYFRRSWAEKLSPILSVANECFHSFIVGQVVEAIIIGVLCGLGMWVFRLPYAPTVGTIVGFTALIPVFGCYLGAGVGALLCLAVSPMKAIEFLIFICILQQLEGNLIYPRVVGTSLGLPGIWVLAAVTIGGGMGGIVGMFFAVPIAATIYRLICLDMEWRRAEKIPEGNDEKEEQT